MNRVRVVIRGRVQGVGFRYFVVSRARALGLSGTVRNRRDGAVEAVGEGATASLSAWVAALRVGPSAARVSDLEEAWSEGIAEHDGFTISE